MSMRRVLGTPRESWLRGDDHDRFAAAIMRCQHGDPSACSSSGRCYYGDCFRRPRAAEKDERLESLERRVKALEDAAMRGSGGKSEVEV